MKSRDCYQAGHAQDTRRPYNRPGTISDTLQWGCRYVLTPQSRMGCKAVVPAPTRQSLSPRHSCHIHPSFHSASYVSFACLPAFACPSVHFWHSFAFISSSPLIGSYPFSQHGQHSAQDKKTEGWMTRARLISIILSHEALEKENFSQRVSYWSATCSEALEKETLVSVAGWQSQPMLALQFETNL